MAKQSVWIGSYGPFTYDDQDDDPISSTEDIFGGSGVNLVDGVDGTGVLVVKDDGDGTITITLEGVEAASFYPGRIAGDAIMFRHFFDSPWDLVKVQVHAVAAPTQSGGVDFDLRRYDNTDTVVWTDSINLPQGDKRASTSLNTTISAGDVLESTLNQSTRTDDCADVITTFVLNAR